MLLRKFHASRLHDFRAERRHFQKFLVRHFGDFAGVFDHARVGCVDAADVGVDLADVGFESRRQRDCRKVASAASERGNVAVAVDSLKARDYHDLAARQAFANVAARDFHYSCAGVGVVGNNARLRARSRHRFDSQRVQRHRRKRDCLLFADGKEHVHLALVGRCGKRFRSGDEFVRHAAAGGDDHDDAVSAVHERFDSLCDIEYSVGIADGRAAVFLYNQSHMQVFLK